METNAVDSAQHTQERKRTVKIKIKINLARDGFLHLGTKNTHTT